MRNNVAAVEPQAAPEIPPTGAKPEKSKKIKIRGIKRSAFAMPYLALSIVFVIVPLFIMLYYAFTDGATGGITGENFAHFFRRPNIMAVMGKSFLVAMLTTVFCFLLAYPLAFGVEFVRAE